MYIFTVHPFVLISCCLLCVYILASGDCVLFFTKIVAPDRLWNEIAR